MIGNNLSEIMTKISSTIECLLFVISEYLLFVIRCWELFAIRYLLFGVTCSNYVHDEQRIFDNYVIFLENIANITNHSLTLFLSVLTQYFIFDQYKKLRKSKYH